VLTDTLEKSAVVSALRHGQFYVQYNGNRFAPFVEGIESDGTTITVDAPEAEYIEWIAEGVPRGTGSTFITDNKDNLTYVRAELHGRDNAVTCLQPFYGA